MFPIFSMDGFLSLKLKSLSQDHDFNNTHKYRPLWHHDHTPLAVVKHRLNPFPRRDAVCPHLQKHQIQGADGWPPVLAPNKTWNREIPMILAGGKRSNLTNVFQMGWNHHRGYHGVSQLVKMDKISWKIAVVCWEYGIWWWKTPMV